jgi:hypothetical protein
MPTSHLLRDPRRPVYHKSSAINHNYNIANIFLYPRPSRNRKRSATYWNCASLSTVGESCVGDLLGGVCLVRHSQGVVAVVQGY